MSEETVSMSTRQASELLGVHESTVKRWCNSDDLGCWHTPGGHRRIPVSALVAFARSNRFDVPLVQFEQDAEGVWQAVESALSEDDFEPLCVLLYDWLDRERVDLPAHLIRYLRSRSVALATVFDRLVGPVMLRIGEQYMAGTLSIGDEHRMTQIMRDVLIRLREPHPINGTAPLEGRVALVGCARNEAHELGALMVRLVLESMRWRVIYLGLNVPPEEFANQQKKHAASLVCVSVIPPTGAAEAHAMVRLLEQMASEGLPYRLAFGGGSIETSRPLTKGQAGLQEVRFFNRLSPFGEWVSGAEL